MRPVHDLEDLRPVVGQVPRTPQDPEVDQRGEPSSGAGPGPSESDRHELDDCALPRLNVHEVHLDRRRHEGEVLSFSRLLDLAEDRPQPFQPRHATGPEPERLSLAHARSVPQRVATRL